MSCPNRITLPTTVEYQLPTLDRMQPSGTAKDVPARMNRLSGIKTRLNLDLNHAGPMKEKTKTKWEHFYNHLFILGEEKHVEQEQVYWCVMQGTEERSSATILQQVTKEYTEQTSREDNTGKNYNDQKLIQFYLKDRRHTLDAHSDQINPVEWQRTFAAMEGGS